MVLKSSCPCAIASDFESKSVTKQDFLDPALLKPASVVEHHRTLTFFTPVQDTGGIMEVSIYSS